MLDQRLVLLLFSHGLAGNGIVQAEAFHLVFHSMENVTLVVAVVQNPKFMTYPFLACGHTDGVPVFDENP